MIVSRILTVFMIVIIGMMVGCSSDDSQNESGQSTSVEDQRAQDEADIQAMLTETIERFHWGDKGALYLNEFEYLRDDYTYDQYIDFDQIKWFNADTVESIAALDYTFLGDDTCAVDVEITFLGPTGKISKDYDTYRVYRQHGRWIKPTTAAFYLQQEYEDLIRAADSAAAAEAEEGL